MKTIVVSHSQVVKDFIDSRHHIMDDFDVEHIGDQVLDIVAFSKDVEELWCKQTFAKKFRQMCCDGYIMELLPRVYDEIEQLRATNQPFMIVAVKDKELNTTSDIMGMVVDQDIVF